MQSMQFAWALLVSMTWTSPSYLPARVAAMVYQVLMALAVIVTENHYFVDVIASISLVQASFCVYQLVLLPNRQESPWKSIR